MDASKEGVNEQCWLCTCGVSGAWFYIWAPLVGWLCTCAVSGAGFYTRTRRRRGERTMLVVHLCYVWLGFIWTPLVGWLCTCAVSGARFYIRTPLIGWLREP